MKSWNTGRLGHVVEEEEGEEEEEEEGEESRGWGGGWDEQKKPEIRRLVTWLITESPQKSKQDRLIHKNKWLKTRCGAERLCSGGLLRPCRECWLFYQKYITGCWSDSQVYSLSTREPSSLEWIQGKNDHAAQFDNRRRTQRGVVRWRFVRYCDSKKKRLCVFDAWEKYRTSVFQDWYFVDGNGRTRAEKRKCLRPR